MTEPIQNDSTDRLLSEAAAKLPPKRDDEPASLRQDILDELADHLGCAFRRELLRTNGNSRQAQVNVVQRFGDPRRIARKLWFDAMRSKLMLQKVLIGTCATLVAACMLFGVLLWQTVGEMRESNAALLTRAQEANATLLEQSRQANAAVLAELKSLKESAATIDPEWNPVTIRLMKGSKNGPPASGFRVTLSGKGDAGSYAGTTDSDGIADCGLMRPSAYELKVTSPWDERLSRTIHVRPGRAIDLAIVCPTEPPKSVPLEWEIKWPSKLHELETRDERWLLALIDGLLRRTFSDDQWSLSGGRRLLAFHPDGRRLNLSTVSADELSPDSIRHDSTIRTFLREREDETSLVEQDHVWAGGEYRVEELGLARWDDLSSPLQLLNQQGMPAITYGYGSPFSVVFAGGTIGNVLKISRPTPSYDVPTAGSAQLEIAVPAGFIAWAKEQEAAEKRGHRFSPQHSAETRLYSLFPPEGDPIPFSEREPAEAPRPVAFTREGHSFASDEGRQVVRVDVRRGSVSGEPLANVAVQLDRAGFVGTSLVERTDEDGLAYFKLLPGSYHSWLTTPWGEHSHARNIFEVYAYQSGGGTRIERIICPSAPPPTTSVDFRIDWPDIARRRDDLWLVLELAGDASRTVGGRSWRDTDGHLVAVHPDGRVIEWKERPGVRHFSYHRLAGLPDLLAKLTLTETPSEYLEGGSYRVLGVGIARWDGEGSPSDLLNGIRDGRYISKTRGAFFYVLREQVPMKADETLPTLGLMSRDAQPATISYTVPESLVAAALQRWDTVPAVTQSSGRR